MDTLRGFLASLPPERREEFAARCGTTTGYLRKVLSTGALLGADLCIHIERESFGAVLCEELRPDTDWAYLRGTKRRTPAPDAAAA